MDFPTAHLPGLAAALGLGLLIGVERERRKGTGTKQGAAGVRTHALLALAGATAALIDPWMLVLGGAGVAALSVASYVRSAPSDAGLTSEIAVLLTYLLGALAIEHPPLAVALGVAVAVLLASKTALHRVTRELISEREMHDLLLLAATALIVLPLLPRAPIDPWGVLKPSSLGKLVVLVMAIGAAGHVALRVIGARWGLPLAGFFAGFASSTAATAGFGQRARATPELRTAAVAAALFANLASLLLFAALIFAGAPMLLAGTRWALGAAAVVLLAGGALGLWHASREEEQLPDRPPARAFRLTHALLFAAIVAAALLVSAWLRDRYGDTSALLAATFVALADLHAAAASIAQLAAGGELSPALARWGVLAMLGASAVVKSILAFTSGGMGYGARVTAGLLLMVAAAALALWLLPGGPAPAA